MAEGAKSAMEGDTVQPMGNEPRLELPYHCCEVAQGPNVHCRLSPSVIMNETVCLVVVGRGAVGSWLGAAAAAVG